MILGIIITIGCILGLYGFCRLLIFLDSLDNEDFWGH